MFKWFKRLFNIGKAQANSVLDKMEDPVKMTEQGINDLKSDLNKSLQGLAEVKAMAIREKKQLEESMRAAAEYENKAILLLQKSQAGELSEAEADRLASQALAKKDQIEGRMVANKKNVEQYDKMVTKMEGNVQQLKSQVSSWENELKSLKARSKVSQATVKLNKQLANVDSSDTLARLERMKEKVMEQEALAESYQEINNQATSVDDEINKALGGDTNKAIASSDALNKLKARLASKTEDSSSNASSSADTGSWGGAATESNDAGGATTPPPKTSVDADLDKLKQKLRGDTPPPTE